MPDLESNACVWTTFYAGKVYLQELRVAAQVPEVHLHLRAVEHDLLHPEVDADGADVPGDEPLLAVALDEAGLARPGLPHGDHLHADRGVRGDVAHDGLGVDVAGDAQLSGTHGSGSVRGTGGGGDGTTRASASKLLRHRGRR